MLSLHDFNQTEKIHPVVTLFGTVWINPLSVIHWCDLLPILLSTYINVMVPRRENFSCWSDCELSWQDSSIFKVQVSILSKKYSLCNNLSQGTNSDYPNLYLYLSPVQFTNLYFSVPIFFQCRVRLHEFRVSFNDSRMIFLAQGEPPKYF